MNTFILSPNDIGKTLAKHLCDSSTIFVFPTDTVMNSWIDWIVTNPTISGCDAIPFERFIAWDNFKSSYLCASENGKEVIPTLLKQLFVHDLIKRNAEKTEAERFKVIINPDDNYAMHAESFAPWITKNLSSLHFWKKRIEQYNKEYGELDDEDNDYLQIYEEYKSFLNKNNLFEPAWVENIDFSNEENTFVIIYPELLQDFADFTEILNQRENVTLYTFPTKVPRPKAYLYSDSRKELRQTMLQIINLVNEKKADWSEIALSVPNLDTYRPYIEREFSLYSIPYVIKAGEKLTKNCAGRIFQEIADCYNSGFTFDTVRTLLLDECVPWKDELKDKREALIREGNRMRCICSPFDTDIWLSALTTKINKLQSSMNKGENSTKSNDTCELEYFEELKDFYIELKKTVSMFFSQKEHTFSNINRSWNAFKTTFLKDISEFSQDANNILSRCIKELEEIISIEKKYDDCNLELESPYQFFLDTIRNKTYTPQTNATGIQIFEYKLSALANFKYQFVIDSSQKNLEISYKRLTFLNSTKRSKLHLLDDDKTLNATEVFLKLYAKQTNENIVNFSAATDTFNGFAIPHSLLDYTKEVPNLDANDYILKEKEIIFGSCDDKKYSFTPEQKQMFENWKKSAISTDTPFSSNDLFKQLLQNRVNPKNGKVNVSARSDLEKFFPCPRKWIYKSVLNLREDSLDTQLMQNYDMGNLNHKILELFMKNYKNEKEVVHLPFFDVEQNSFFQQDNTTKKDVSNDIYALLNTKITEQAIKSISDFKDSPLVIQTLTLQKTKITETIITFLKTLLLPTPEGIGNCIVKNIEQEYSAENEKFNYFGKIDSIFEATSTNDNKVINLIIIDYKNSKSSFPKSDGQKNNYVDDDGFLTDFQMPVYNKLEFENFIKNNKIDNKKYQIYGMYYYSIKDCKKIIPYEQNNTIASPEKYEKVLGALDEYAALFTESFSNCNFEPTTSKTKGSKLNVKTYEHCIECAYKSICRTTYCVAGKEISKSDGVKNETI